MANTTGLTKKGAPPAREASVSVIEADPRVEEGRKQPLQVKIPVDVHTAFSVRAGEEFGFTSGSKTKLFLAMWDAYQKR
mgnify:CR=1 FL=1